MAFMPRMNGNPIAGGALKKGGRAIRARPVSSAQPILQSVMTPSFLRRSISAGVVRFRAKSINCSPAKVI